MANFELAFRGCDDYYEHRLVAFTNDAGRLFIEITEQDSAYAQHIILDRSTAVMLVKELKKQIALMDNEEL